MPLLIITSIGLPCMLAPRSAPEKANTGLMRFAMLKPQLILTMAGPISPKRCGALVSAAQFSNVKSNESRGPPAEGE